MKKNGRLIYPYAIFSIMLVIVPTLLLLVNAFYDQQGYFTWNNIEALAKEEVVNVFLYSFAIAIRVTVICIILSYPAAYFLSRKRLGFPGQMILFFLLPMGVNMLLNTFSMVAVIDILRIPRGGTALCLGLVYDFLPFMIQPIYNSMCQLDDSLIEASRDLGAGKLRTFFTVIVPISAPGVISGTMMVLLPAVSTFSVSELITMNNIKLFGSVIENSINRGMIGYGAALSLVMMLIIVTTELIVKKD